MNIQEENNKRMQILRDNFKLLREERGWSVEQLALISGISKSKLSGAENGTRISLDTLFTLCDIYSVKPHEMFLPMLN